MIRAEVVAPISSGEFEAVMMNEGTSTIRNKGNNVEANAIRFANGGLTRVHSGRMQRTVPEVGTAGPNHPREYKCVAKGADAGGSTSCATTVAKPRTKPPSAAPPILPSPPNTVAINPRITAWDPSVYEAVPTCIESMTPAAAAMTPLIANDRATTRLARTPTSLAI